MEGHIPVPEIRRLLRERPDGVGLAVTGMAVGAPGMAADDSAPEPYSVLLIKKDGSYELYQDYPAGGP